MSNNQYETMKGHSDLERLIEDHRELDIKIDKISSFMSSDKESVMDTESFDLLGYQYLHMICYRKAMACRIKKMSGGG